MSQSTPSASSDQAKNDTVSPQGELGITPGPWCIEEPLDRTIWIVQANKESYEWDPIALISINVEGDPDDPREDHDIPLKQQWANARAIAALPDLVKAADALLQRIAVENMMPASTKYRWYKNEAGALRSALSKVKGETE